MSWGPGACFNRPMMAYPLIGRTLALSLVVALAACGGTVAVGSGGAGSTTAAGSGGAGTTASTGTGATTSTTGSGGSTSSGGSCPLGLPTQGAPCSESDAHLHVRHVLPGHGDVHRLDVERVNLQVWAAGPVPADRAHPGPGL